MDDLEHLGSEGFDQTLGEHLADAREGGRGQVAREPLGVLGPHYLGQLELELAPVNRVGDPVPVQPHPQPLGGSLELPDGGRDGGRKQRLRVVEARLRRDPQDRVQRLAVVVRDALDRALEHGPGRVVGVLVGGQGWSSVPHVARGDEPSPLLERGADARERPRSMFGTQLEPPFSKQRDQPLALLGARPVQGGAAFGIEGLGVGTCLEESSDHAWIRVAFRGQVQGGVLV